MDPRDREFYDDCFAIEMEVLADAAAADGGTFPPSLDERRRMRCRYIETARTFRDIRKAERQLQHKLGAAWTLVLDYLGGYFLGLKVQPSIAERL